MISERDDKKIKKSNTKLMIISVLVLTILTLNVSYSAFFDVKVQPNLYSFKAGTLNVTVNGSNQSTWQKELKPVDVSSITTGNVPASGYVTLTIQNSGDIDAKYSVSLVNDALPGDASDPSDRLSNEYLYVGIYDTQSSKWVTIGNQNYAKLSTLKNGDDNKYPILNDTINKKGISNVTQKTYRIYVWLTKDTPVTEIGKLVYFKVNVHSTPVEGQQ